MRVSFFFMTAFPSLIADSTVQLLSVSEVLRPKQCSCNEYNKPDRSNAKWG
jgi:hypothetical protein